MTQICYSLEETARRLDMSETVLVRLSQYFKVPQSAYEEMGFLSFKGDLAFSDQDIGFFRQVKEHLLAGESLETVKTRIREPQATQMPRKDTSFLEATRRVNIETLTEQKLVAPSAPPIRQQGEPQMRQAEIEAEILDEILLPVEPEPVAIQPIFPAPLREVEAPEMLQQAADASFERYKGKTRPQTNRGPKIFEKMIRQVGQSGEDKPFSSLPFAKPIKPKVETNPEFTLESMFEDEPDAGLRDEREIQELDARKPIRLEPIGLAQTRDIEFDRQAAQSQEVAAVLNERFPWKAHIQQASRQPRPLDDRLKQAAKLIREQATGS